MKLAPTTESEYDRCHYFSSHFHNSHVDIICFLCGRRATLAMCVCVCLYVFVVHSRAHFFRFISSSFICKLSSHIIVQCTLLLHFDRFALIAFRWPLFAHIFVVTSLAFKLCEYTFIFENAFYKQMSMTISFHYF